MKIYIDFDGTIYDTHKLDNKFIDIFQKYNIDSNYIKKLIDKIKNYNTIANILIQEFNLNNNILNEINSIYSNELVFKDIIPFLEKYYQKHNLILLTLTNDIDYQQRKINSSNLKKYFKDIIITTKDKSKLTNIDYSNGIFIDNNPIELKKFYNSNAKNLIRIKRDNDKYSKLSLDINNITEYKNFIDLLNSNHIEQIGDEINE